jgi:hypothetical protein
MTAFLDFLKSSAIWIYIAGVIGILFGIKMLVDSRRLARTTMFTLEQEQASDKAFRAVLVLFIFALIIVAVSVINSFVTPNLPLPTPESTAQQSTLQFTPPVILPSTATSTPTLTPEAQAPPPSVAPTREPQSTTAPTRPVVATPTPLSPQPKPTVTNAPTSPGGLIYPLPVLVAPVDGETVGKDRIQFRWDNGDVPPQLPTGQVYKITVQYTDSHSNQLQELPKCTSFSNEWTTTWQVLVDARGKAVGNKYSWFVVVLQLLSPDSPCASGTPISPPSKISSYIWQ